MPPCLSVQTMQKESKQIHKNHRESGRLLKETWLHVLEGQHPAENIDMTVWRVPTVTGYQLQLQLEDKNRSILIQCCIADLGEYVGLKSVRHVWCSHHRAQTWAGKSQHSFIFNLLMS